MSKKLGIFSVVNTICLLALSGSLAAPVFAAEEVDQVAEDECLVELGFPDGTTISVDGRDYGVKKRLTYPSLAPGQTYKSRIVVTFPDGQKEQHVVFIQAGRRIRLGSVPPSASRPEIMLPLKHTSDVECFALSPDGRYMATGSEDRTAILWNAKTGQQLRVFRGHTNRIRALTFSHDGKHLATGGDERVILWDVVTGQEVRVFNGRARDVIALAMSPTGRHLATGHNDTGVLLWDVSTGRRLRKLATNISVNCLAFSPDGRQLLTGASNSVTGERYGVLWDLFTGRRIQTYHGHSGNLRCGAFSPDGSQIVTGGDVIDNTVILWDAATGKQLQVFPSRGFLASGISSLAFDPHGKQVLVGSISNRVTLWDAVGGKRINMFGAGRGVAPVVQFTADGNELLIAGQESVVWRNRADGTNVREWQLTEDRSYAFLTGTVAYSPNGRYLLASRGDQASLWDGATGRPLCTLTAGGRASFSPDGRQVLIAKGDTVSVWDAFSGENRANIHVGDQVYSASMSLDGRHVLTSSLNRTAELWDAETGVKQRTFHETNGENYAAFSPDGQHVLASHDRRGVALWELATGKQVRFYEGHDGWIKCVGFSPDGAYAVLGEGTHNRGEAILWDVVSGRELRTFGGHNGYVNAVAFSPDGEYLLTGSDDGQAFLWNAKTGQRLLHLEGHANSVTDVAFGPQGQLLTSSEDGSARLWDPATGKEILRLIYLGDYRTTVSRKAPVSGWVGSLASRFGIGTTQTTRQWHNDWVVMTPDGLFDGTENGRSRVMFRVGGGLNVVPVDRFFQDFYYPGLLSAIWRGERPMPDVEIGQSLPPALRIVSPSRGGTVETQQVTVEVEAVDKGGGVRGPWLYQNGVQVLGSPATQRDGEVVRKTFAVQLVQGENELEFRAASADGSWESEPVAIAFRYEKPLPKPELFLVTVGINEYAEPSMKLKFAEADAATMAGLFRERAKNLYQDVHVTALTNDAATEAAILAAIRGMREKSEPQDTVVLFLAGHGTIVGKQYYFLPQGFTREAATLEEDARAKGLSAAEVGEALATVPALKRMVVFDTGQSGTAGLARTTRDPFSFRGAIERLCRAQGLFSIASASSSDEAQEVGELRHGILTYSLLAGLRAAEGGPLEKQWVQPARGDHVADVTEWFGFASTHVPRLTEQYFGRQQQIEHGSIGMSFPVLPVPETGDVPEPVRVASRADSSPRERSDAVRGTGQGTVFVVAVGVSQYTQPSLNLKYAAADARAIAELFRLRGGRLYRDVKVKLLLDKDATKDKITQTLKDIDREATQEDTLCVFLSGHGQMVGQRYYFIPYEFRRQAATVEDDIRQQGLPADVLGDAIREVPARNRLLVFDTCASGGALGLSRQGGNAYAFQEAIQVLGKERGVFAIAASSAGAEAQEIDELGHGVLTYALLAGLRATKPGGPLEGLAVRPNSTYGTVDILEWFSYASGHVPRLTKRYLGVEQDVQMSGQGRSFSVLTL